MTATHNFPVGTQSIHRCQVNGQSFVRQGFKTLPLKAKVLAQRTADLWVI
ncbi:MAG: hypothetical protein KME17_02190 [Cyanosarcina radialis HA8281-LM2]|nr:hypothetical protein [Cyanosarcina radialis HA8281-LM2]